MQGAALLFLLLAPSLVFADNFDGSANVQTNRSVISENYCFLACSVKYNGVKKGDYISDNYFNVSWTYKPRTFDDEFYSVTRTTFWHKNFNTSISVTDPKCSITSRPTSGDGPVLLSCGLTIASCSNQTEKTLRPYDGIYRCLVQHRVTGASFGVTSELKLALLTDNTNDGELPCFPPKAVNISAVMIAVNSTEKVSVHWESTPRTGSKPYCSGSRRWSVGVLPHSANSLKTLTDNQKVEFPPVPGLFTSTAIPRQTFLEIEVPRRDKYYLFVVRNEYKKNDQPVYQDFTSSIYYFGEQTSPYFINREDIVLHHTKGDTALIECPAGGIPQPEVQLIHNGRVLGTVPSTGFAIRNVALSHSGDYYCSASNTHVNPPQGKRRLTVNKKITIHVDIPTTDLPCRPYNGGMCRNYIHEDTDILVHNPATMETNISHHIGTINTLASDHWYNFNSPVYREAAISGVMIEECYQFTRALACNTVYQYCDAKSTIAVPVARPICKHTCAIIEEDGPCGFYMSSNFLSDRQQLLAEISTALFSRCDNRTAPAGTSPECLSVSLNSPAVDQPGDVVNQLECVKGNGRSYSGDLSRTVSGAPCQSWYSQRPNTHSIVPAHFQLELFGADFSCRNPGGLGERPWCYTALEGGPRWEYCDAPLCESCEKYTGEFCSALTGYKDRGVYLNREGWVLMSMEDIERSMLGFYHSLSANSLSPACQNSLQLLICHGSLPFCPEQGPPSPLPSCGDHCSLVEEMRVACPEKVIEETKRRWKSINPVTRLQAPNCSLVTDSQTCMPSPEIIISTKDINKKCFNSSDNGQNYRGPVAKSITEMPCLEWTSVNSSFTEERYPELIGAGNSCRNPGRWGLAPWCFVSKYHAELCLVSSCTDSERDDKSVPSNASSVAAPLVLVICLALVFVIVSLGIGYMVYRHRRRQHTLGLMSTPPQPKTINSDTDTVKNVVFTSNDQYYRLNPKVADAIASFKQIPKANIEYVKQLGQGCFGMVFKGKWKSFEGTEMFVAVKTLKEDSNDGIEAFVNEAKLMFGFDHDHIVQILGVSMTASPYYLVFEYMDKGDLAGFLRENASSLQRRFMNPLDRPRSRTESTLSDDPATLNTEQLTDIVQQIAKGMEYLSLMNHVHRDLACRNCLVSSVPDSCEGTPSKVIVKIGDFGLSHNLYSKDYYRVRGNAVLPIRWMAPEAIIYGKFSTAGDVWSFGVVMWEVFTFGMQPYYGTSNDEVMEKVRHGKVLEKPTDCSGRIYAIMNECWTRDSQSRPSFTELRQYLEECRVSTSSEYDAQSMYSDYSSDAFLEENSDAEIDFN